MADFIRRASGFPMGTAHPSVISITPGSIDSSFRHLPSPSQNSACRQQQDRPGSPSPSGLSVQWRQTTDTDTPQDYTVLPYNNLLILNPRSESPTPLMYYTWILGLGNGVRFGSGNRLPFFLTVFPPEFDKHRDGSDDKERIERCVHRLVDAKYHLNKGY